MAAGSCFLSIIFPSLGSKPETKESQGPRTEHEQKESKKKESPPSDGEESGSDSSDIEILDPDQENAAGSHLAKLRKQAGLPEMPEDSLPSGLANKIMCSALTSAWFCIFPPMHPTSSHQNATPRPRACLTKRSTKLSDLLKKFEDVEDKKALDVPQTRSVNQQMVSLLSNHVLTGPFSSLILCAAKPRLKAKVDDAIKSLNKIHEQILSQYTDGLVDGFTKKRHSLIRCFFIL